MASDPTTNPFANGDNVITPPNGIPDHTLIRRIGQGSYGDVWLGRSVLGAYRAVKIVYRQRFEDEGPYEREFRGIQMFEPISRSHEGFVDILQVGRNDQEGYFYYIMEVGDDRQSVQKIDPNNYQAKTLASERKSRGRFDFSECVAIATAIASALQYLHNHKLLHRDVKPSNIIFVEGVPKLADIGLVAAMTEARSFVGTEGYIPPEGPGTRSADIYSLGKVLYEICTGRDRKDYPTLPLDWSQYKDHSKLIELNEIILRACEGDAARRYASADEMLEDLHLLGAGGSLRRLRMLERRWTLLSRVALVGVGIILVGSGVFYSFYREYWNRKQAKIRQAQAAVGYGVRLLEDGDWFGAQQRFAEALSLNHDASQDELTHRVRIGTLSRQCPKLVQCWSESGSVYHAAFSPDGRFLATATSSGAIHIHDVRGGQRVGSTNLAHGLGKGARSVCFSPDGKILLTSGSDTDARRWDWATGTEILPPLAHDSEVYSARFSPDGKRIVTGCANGDAFVWEVGSTVKPLKLKGHHGGVLFAEFSPDGTRVVTASSDGSAWVWNALTGEPGPRLWHKSWVFQATFSPDNKVVATASYDRTTRFWDVRNGQPLYRPLVHPAAAVSVEFSPDGRYVATSGYDFAARVWDVKEGELANPPLEHDGQIYYTTFSPSGRFLVTASHDRTARLWDLEANNWLPPSTKAVASADGQRLFTWEANLLRWSSDIGAAEPGNSLKLPFAMQGLACNSSGSYIMAISTPDLANQGQIRVQGWNIEKGEALGQVIEVSQARKWLVSEDGARAISWAGKRLELWDLQKGYQIAAPPMGDSITHVTMSPDSRYWAVGAGTRIQIYNLADGLSQGRPLPHAWNVSHFSFSPDSSLLVSACRDDSLDGHFAQVWSVPSGKLRPYKLRHRDGILFTAFSPNGKLILTTSEDFTASLWNVETGKEAVPPLKHKFQIQEANFSLDGRWLVTGGSDQTARVWDVESGEAITPPFVHPDNVLHVQFLGKNRAILTTTSAGQKFVWDLTPDDRPIEGIRKIADFQAGRSTAQGELAGNLGKLRMEGLLVQSRTTNTLIWHERQAETAERKKDYFAADFHLTRLLKSAPQDSALRLRRGVARAGLEKWSQADDDLRAGIMAGGTGLLSWCYYGRVCLMLGEEAEFRTAAREILRLLPAGGAPSDLLAAAFTLQLSPCPQDHKQILTLLAALRTALPAEEQRILLCQAVVLLRSGQPEQALKSLSVLLKSPTTVTQPEALLISALAHCQLNQPDRAAACQQEAAAWIKMALEEKPVLDAGIRISWDRKIGLKALQDEVEAALSETPDIRTPFKETRR